MTYYSTITSKGQLTLPADIRAKMHIKAGQRVAIRLNQQGDAVIEQVVSLEELRKKTRQSLKAQGLSASDQQALAKNYRNGDGFTAAVKESHGQR